MIISAMAEKVPTHIQEFFRKVKHDNIGDFSIALSTNKAGEGFVAVLLIVTLTNNITKEEEFIIIKQQKDAQGKSLEWSNQNFLNEIYFYYTIWPKLQTFYNKTTGKYLDIIPKCLGASQIGVKMIAMENLKVAGFEIYNSTQPFDEDHLNMTFKTFGIFHGVSMALREKCGAEFCQLIEHIVNEYKNMFTGEDLLSRAIIHAIGNARKLFDPVVEKELVGKLTRYEEEGPKMIREALNETASVRVITHGDSWSNNFMYRYNVSMFHVPCSFIQFSFILTIGRFESLRN